MLLDIIQIGNSKGLRLPKTILEQCHIKKTVDVKVENCTLIITPSNKPRQGWEKAFQAMAENHDDQLLDLGAEMQPWDEEEWQW